MFAQLRKRELTPNHLVARNVGNKIAVFVLQSLGCEVSALNTVQFSESPCGMPENVD